MRRDPANASDANLVLSIARFDEGALAELYRRHAGSDFALAKRILREQAVAEYVVQEVFLRLWNQPDRFDVERGSLRSYLLSIAHGRSIDLLRADGARRERERREARVTAEGGYDVEREVWDLTLAAHVREAISSLPGEERQAIELAYFGGHTYREVASLLEEPEGTIKSRIRAGLKRMHSSLGATGITSTRGAE
jgi:RNA polymerase sigma-70 factor (ECF subfamily)